MKLYQIMFVPLGENLSSVELDIQLKNLSEKYDKVENKGGNRRSTGGILTETHIELLRSAISELGEKRIDNVRAQVAFYEALVDAGYTKSDSDS